MSTTETLDKFDKFDNMVAVKRDFPGYELLFVVIAGAAVVVPRGPFTAFAAIALLLIPVTARMTKQRSFRFLSIIVLVWTALTVLSSLIHSEVRWATLFTAAYPIAILGCALLFGRMSNNNEAQMLRLASAVGIALIMGYTVQPIGVGENDPLKAGLGAGILILTFALLSLTTSNPNKILFVSLFIAAIFFYLDFRNPALISIVVGAAIATVGRRNREITLGIVVISISILVATVGLVAVMYSSLASNGTFGPEAQARYERQASVTGGLLLGARPEIAVSVEAISNKPWLGRGGAPKATSLERAEAISNLEKAGLQVSSRQVARLVGSGVNSHSLVFTAWVTHGVVGAVMWLVLLVWIWAGALTAVFARLRMTPLLLYGALQFSWDVFFSPWGPRTELVVGIYCALSALAMYIVSNTQNSRNLSASN